jgi:signal transduction histidine kinase
MLRQVNRLARLVGNLLDVSRIRGGQLSLARLPVDLAALTRGVLDDYGDLLAAAGCQLEARLSPVTGVWDGGRLEQVLTNLLGNVMKFGAGQPVRVTVEAEGTGAARWIVQDGGPGISEAALATLFQPFARGTASLSWGGLGLGLYISKAIVEAHGGSISVESTAGRGATFTVRLPLVPPSGAAVVEGGPGIGA